MHLRPRHLIAILGFGMFLGPVFAQEMDLLTEAPVTFQVTFTTANTTSTGTPGNETKKTATTTSRILQANVIQELFTSGIIPTNSGWSLKAVRSAPADLAFVTAQFSLYAVNPAYTGIEGTRIPIPTSKFLAAAYGSVEKYVEKHQGQYILSASGTVTNHVGYDYLPSFISLPPATTATVGTDKVTTQLSTAFTLNTMHSEGFASISFALSDVTDILYYAIKSMNVTAIGDFTGNSVTTTTTTTVPASGPTVISSSTGPSVPSQGLVTLTLTVGAPILVDASLYPAVNPFP